MVANSPTFLEMTLHAHHVLTFVSKHGLNWGLIAHVPMCLYQNLSHVESIIMKSQWITKVQTADEEKHSELCSVCMTDFLSMSQLQPP